MTENNEKKILGLDKKKLGVLLKLIFSIAVIVFLFISLDFDKILLALKSAEFLPLFIAFSLGAVNLYLKFYKWNYLLINVIGENNTRKNWASFIIGVTSGIITPARIGEFVGRGVPFKNHKIMTISSLVMIDKIPNLIMIYFFGSIALFAAMYFSAVESNIFNIILLCVGIALFPFLYFVLKNKNLINKSRFLNENLYFQKFKSAVQPLKTINKKILLNVFAQTTIMLSVNFVQLYFLLDAFYQQNNPAAFFLMSVLIFFGKTFLGSIAFAEIGVREGLAVYFAGQFSVIPEAAFNASLILFFINVLIPALIGLFYINKKYD